MRFSRTILVPTFLLGSFLLATLTVAADQQGQERHCNRSGGSVYIAFFGGAGDSSKTRLIERLADKWRLHYSQYVVKYYTWNQTQFATRDLSKILDNCPHKNSKVLLIGHSLGGDTAYDVAQSMRKYSVGLITLDPASMSGRAWKTYGVWPLLWISAQHNKMPNPTSKRGIWVNIHAQSSAETDIGIFPLSLIGLADYHYHSSCNAVAWAGRPWGRQRKADRDYVVSPAPFDTRSVILTHCSVGRMLFQAFKDSDLWTNFFQRYEMLPIPEFYPEDE